MSWSQPATPLSAFKPLTIQIGGTDSRAYKSIDSLTWEAIPPFAVLTGLNGSGKTQLLQLLAFWITNTWLPGFSPNDQRGNPRETKIVFEGDSFGAEEIAYLLSSDYLQGSVHVSLAQLQQTKQQLYQNLRQDHRQNLHEQSRRARIERLLGTSLNTLTVEDFAKKLPDDFVFMLGDTDVITGLGYVFVAYRLQFLQELEKRLREGLPPKDLEEEVLAKLGPAPWDVVNQALETAGFSYRVSSPIQEGLLRPYELKLVDLESRMELNPQDLSSGEKVILQLVLWLYNSKHHNRFPRLLLLDEPDAHLHPSMTRQFMDVIKEVLVDRYKVRVILTTHSPSTVAMAPDDSVFVMSRVAPRIRPAESKSTTIRMLTAGFVTVSRSTRYVLVEDQSDVSFYSAIRDILSVYGPSKDPRALRPAPSIVFLPASVGSGEQKVGGGKNVVIQWIEKFDAPPLDEIFRGIIDHDVNNFPRSRILVIDRYSIENYLLDPFVIFSLLLSAGTMWSIPEIKITQGDEHRIREMTEAQLQIIASSIATKVEPSIHGLRETDLAPYIVKFTNSRSVRYPTWMIKHQGRDLLRVYQRVFGGPAVISYPRLEASLRRVRLIPEELANVMSQLQNLRG